ncbi:MAG: ribonuclease PH [Phycisphaerales bacterium]|nr:ribonuclease PH [Phycisphaerales bacterium]
MFDMERKNRPANELRPIEILRGFTRQAAGSVLIRQGGTHVLCTASIEQGLPPWREPSGRGWVTAEYDMLPAATSQRRARNRTKIDGRTQEIQRLIGRSLRAVVDMQALGPRTVILDCDVLQADGGTRTAAITGAWIALADAVRVGADAGWWGPGVLTAGVAAVSVGLVNGELLLDLDYAEDARAAVDCNLVLTTRNEWVEVQATAEGRTYSDDEMLGMLALGRAGITALFAQQQAALAAPLPRAEVSIL